MTKSQAYKKYQKASNEYQSHIYTTNGQMRAVLSHEKAYFEARKQELQSKMRAAYNLFKSI